MTSRPTRRTGVAGIIAGTLLILAVVAVLVGGWWDRVPQEHQAQTPSASNISRTVDRVVVMSIDGLASYAVTPEAMPELTSLLEEGAGTLNARTIELTITLPNHTSMVTGRPAMTTLGGHGVDWNEDMEQTTVRDDIESVFSVLDDRDLGSAAFTSKEKFEIWNRSWPIDRFVVNHSLDELVDEAVDDLESEHRGLTFIHVASPDTAGHESGWASADYDVAVARADAAVGRVVDSVRNTSTALVVTADHGGIRGTKGHYDVANPEAYTIPFVVWGPHISNGDLYELNRDYRNPGTEPPSYETPPSIRNADVANLVTELLGIGAVPGSSINAAQGLDVVAGVGE